ncbi:MAG: site-specific integrase [Paludibacteraceae bacterium]|nr:site-specific integrase [Paludibacteraceae bacterium]
MAKKSLIKPQPRLSAGMDVLKTGFQFFIMDAQQKGLSPHTIDSYSTWFMSYLAPFARYYAATFPQNLANPEKGLCVCDLDNLLVVSCLREWLLQTKNLSDYSVHSVINYYAIFYHCFSRHGLISHRTFANKKVEQPIKTLYTDEQLLKLLEPPKDKNNFSEVRNWVITNYVLGTGNRRGSIVDITMGDCRDLAEHNHIRLTHTKNGKQQIVYVPEAVKHILLDFIREWRAQADDKDFLFCNQFGSKLKASTLTAVFSRYARERLGKNGPTSLHLLRHQFAATYLRTGGHIEDLKKALNHSSFSQVMWYADKYDTPAPEKNEPFNIFHTLAVPQKKKLKPKK